MDAPVLIFGGTGGVGFELARRLVAEGGRVHVAARDQGRLQRCAEALGGAGHTRCDVLEPAQIAAAVGDAAAGGSLAGLAYCVGSIVIKPLKRSTPQDFVDTFRLNALGAALAVQAAEPALRAGKGAVLLFSTIAAGGGFPNHAVIATAKGAVESLTRTLAADLAPDVRVNCIAPSLVRTPLSAQLTGSEAMIKSLAGAHPIPRLGEPADIAALADFLLGPQSGWITGQVFPVDGGRSSIRSRG